MVAKLFVEHHLFVDGGAQAAVFDGYAECDGDCHGAHAAQQRIDVGAGGACAATCAGRGLRGDDRDLLRVAVLATADLRVDRARTAGGSDWRWPRRLAASGEPVERTSGFVAPKSVLVVVVVEHFVTPSIGSRSALWPST